MIGTVLTDGEDNPRVEWPAHKTKPTTVLLQHSRKAALPSQQKAIDDFCASEAAKRAAECDAARAALQSSPSTPSSSRESSPITPTPPATLASHTTGTSKWAYIEEIDNEDAEDEECENARINPKPSKGQCNNLN